MEKYYSVTYSIDNEKRFFSSFFVKANIQDGTRNSINKAMEITRSVKESKKAVYVTVTEVSLAEVEQFIKRGKSLVTWEN